MIQERPSAARLDAGAFLAALRAAESASAEERWAEAAPLWERVVAANPVHGAYWLQLGVSRAGAGKDEAAIEAFERALELGCAFPPPGAYEHCFPWGVAYEIARCHARLGDVERALEWLERSLAAGYRARAAIREEPAFAGMREHPRFTAIVGGAGAGEAGRDEGWRRDLAWLAGEIKRLHYAPFRQIDEQAFDAAVRELHEAIPNLNDAERLVGLMKIMRRLGDGHSRLAFWQEREEYRIAPITCYWFEEGVFITAASPPNARLTGAQILAVGEHPIEDVLKALDTVISQDNPMWSRLLAPFFLTQPHILHGLGLIGEPGALPLSARTADGAVRSVSLAAEGQPIIISRGFGPPDDWARAAPRGADAPLYLRDAGNYWFERLPGQDAIYMQYKRVVEDEGEPFAAFCERLFAALDESPGARLIIDLRRNSGGNTFLHRPLLRGIMRRPLSSTRGALFVIIGRNTFSAAMNGATTLERHTEAIFVGEPTGASPNFVGETTLVTLPYTGLQASLSDLYWQTSWPMDYRLWIAPEIYAPPRFEDYAAGRDPALEAILAYPRPE